MTELGRSTLLLNSKALEQMTAECWRWRPRWNRLASSTSCLGSSACLQSSSSVLCKTAYGLESPQNRLGGTHAEGAGHPVFTNTWITNIATALAEFAPSECSCFCFFSRYCDKNSKNLESRVILLPLTACMRLSLFTFTQSAPKKSDIWQSGV